MVQENPFNELTDAERKVAELLATGRANKEIAQELGMGKGTVKTHVRDIYQKFDIHGRTEFGRLWERWHPAK